MLLDISTPHRKVLVIKMIFENLYEGRNGLVIYREGQPKRSLGSRMNTM